MNGLDLKKKSEMLPLRKQALVFVEASRASTFESFAACIRSCMIHSASMNLQSGSDGKQLAALTL